MTSSTARSNRAYVVGMDIGGANLKFADSSGNSRVLPFALWRQPDDLAAAVAAALADFAPAAHYAITMTGELADCFDGAAQGVRHIVQQVVAVVGDDPGTVGFYTVDGCFQSAAAAMANPDPLAAANWHALASLLAASVDGPSLLIDIGSTTTDLIPLDRQRVATDSRSDFDRLRRRELVYVGIGRTPVCAVVDRLPIAGKRVPVMNEVFATTDDCALLVGVTAEAPDDVQTADGRPRTRLAAANRLARMVGLDGSRITVDQAKQMASAVLRRIDRRIAAAARQVAPVASHWILSGHGCDVLTVPATVCSQRLCDSLGNPLSRVAPAYAVARLFQQSLTPSAASPAQPVAES